MTSPGEGGREVNKNDDFHRPGAQTNNFQLQFTIFGPTDFGGWSYRLTHVRPFVRPFVRLSGLFLNNRS